MARLVAVGLPLPGLRGLFWLIEARRGRYATASLRLAEVENINLPSRPKVVPKSAQSWPRVHPKSAQSRPKVGPKLVQSRPKVVPRSTQASAQGRPKLAKIRPIEAVNWVRMAPEQVLIGIQHRLRSTQADVDLPWHGSTLVQINPDMCRHAMIDLNTAWQPRHEHSNPVHGVTQYGTTLLSADAMPFTASFWDVFM